MKSLLELYNMTENDLKPEQEDLVAEFADKIAGMLSGDMHPDELKDVLRDLVRRSEQAEGEDLSDVEEPSDEDEEEPEEGEGEDEDE